MTWGSFIARSINLVVVLPLLLNRLSTEEIALWYIFVFIFGLQMLADLGLYPTFSRIIAYGYGGLSIDELYTVNDYSKEKIKRGPDWDTIEIITGTMRRLYTRVALLSFVIIITIGSWAVKRPISLIDDAFNGWIAWVVLVTAFLVVIKGNQYGAYLQGINKVALQRRWEMVVSLFSGLSMMIVLLVGGSLLALVVTYQFWQIVNVLRNYLLSINVEEGKFKTFTYKYSARVFEYVWKPAWRSALGIFLGYGVVQISGIVYSQFGEASSVATYLVALKLMRTLSQFSQAPFYSKLPEMAKLYSKGEYDAQLKMTKRGMLFSLTVFSLGFMFAGISGEYLFELMSSNAAFPTPLLWGLLGLGFFFERYGAMHIQLYSLTNHIVWHIANGVSGAIFIVLCLVTYPNFGVYGFALSYLLSNLAFYSWYSVGKSYKEFNLSFPRFEMRTSVVPFCILILYLVISLQF